MAIVVTQGFSSKHFSSNIPDVAFSITGAKAMVALAVNGTEIYNEILYPVNGIIELLDIPSIVDVFAKEKVVCTLALSIKEMDAAGDQLATSSVSCTVIYSRADIDVSADVFCENHFLSLLDGPKITSMGRLEYLHYNGNESASVTARYADGTTQVFAATMVSGNANFKTIDVSPERFAASGKTLVEFRVTAGLRSQLFLVDLVQRDCAPILLFENSFGCEELLYCTGTHKVSPKYERQSARFRGLKKNYRIDEQRVFEANTGGLNRAMANWADELFRSETVKIVNIYNGVPAIGREVALSESKSEVTNDDDFRPAFTFSYEYAQRNHNVLQTARAGRIFDNTFDMTFN